MQNTISTSSVFGGAWRIRFSGFISCFLLAAAVCFDDTQRIKLKLKSLEGPKLLCAIDLALFQQKSREPHLTQLLNGTHVRLKGIPNCGNQID